MGKGSKLTLALALMALLRITALEDKVAVFRDEALLISYDAPLAVLPEADRLALRQGILVLTEAGASRVTEDFCS